MENRKTTFPFSMDCTKEQYEDVEPILKSMGYITNNFNEGNIIVNNFGSGYKDIALLPKRYNIDYNRTYVGKFNKELLLALYALDSDNDKGKWYKYIGAGNDEFTKNNLYKCTRDYINTSFVFIDDSDECNGFRQKNSIYFTPATPQEIINHLKEKEDMDTTKQISPEELLKSKKFYIKGNKERADEIKEIFKRLNVSVFDLYDYNHDTILYFIDSENNIHGYHYGGTIAWLLQQAFTEYVLPEKQKEYSMDEIAKALGVKVEELKIKK